MSGWGIYPHVGRYLIKSIAEYGRSERRRALEKIAHRYELKAHEYARLAAEYRGKTSKTYQGNSEHYRELAASIRSEMEGT